MEDTIGKISEELLQHHPSLKNLVLIGIQTRGVELAFRLQDLLFQKTSLKLPLGILDINLYRDDFSMAGAVPVVKKTTIPFSIENTRVLLVDDVLYTGRTIRAALNALHDLGRPQSIELAVLIDRGGRELPIAANYIGWKYFAQPNENIQVCFEKTDEVDQVIIQNPNS